MKPILPPLWVWAARDALRRPGESLLSAVAVASLVTTLAAALLLAQGLGATTETVLEGGPSLVVRRVGPGGWAPIPLTALDRVRAVRGVTRATPRTWGFVRRDDTAVTVVAAHGSDMPTRKAMVGPAFDLEFGDVITLEGVEVRSFEVDESLPPSYGMVAHDLVVVAPSEARTLLGLEKGTASDLALWVFHDSEMDAIRPDLERALPFPVKITTLTERLGAERTRIDRTAGIRTALLVPALLALALLTVAATRIQLGTRGDIGLLKAMGWRTADVVRLHTFRGLVIALPAMAAGWAAAYILVFVGGATWAGRLLFDWGGTAPPHLTLDPAGALLTLVEVGGLVLAPWLAAVVLPALRSSATDPEQWLRGEGT